MDKSFSETYLDFKQINPETMNQAILDTLYMTLISMVLVTIIGLVLGLILYSIGRKNKPYARIIYGIVSIISNIFRSTPFMILMVLIIPFTKAIVGTMLGAQAAIPARVFSAAAFYARLVEIACREVSPGVLEAAFGRVNHAVGRVDEGDPTPSMLNVGSRLCLDPTCERHRTWRTTTRAICLPT